jgi:S-(hydroxymethyl)glutathione dehydrogenase/alcohol dehydrogenase
VTLAQAAVLRQPGETPRVEEIRLRDPGPHQVRVRLAATGVCHSDYSLAKGILVQTFPTVLGHEGAGTVVATGEGSRLHEGDDVVLNWTPACRACWFCTHGEPYLCERATEASRQPYATTADDTDVFPGLGVAAFATETVIDDNACVTVPDGTSLEQAALLGCAVLTGMGAVRNTGNVRAGESVAVIGLGGIGLSAVQGASIAGAAPIIAIDPSGVRRERAQRLGATHVLDPSAELARSVRALTDGRGVDCAVECVGTGETIRATWSMTRRGGRAVVVGMGAKTDAVSFNALEIAHFARSLAGCMYGSSDPDRDIPQLLELMRARRLDVDALVSARITLEQLPEAFDELASGRGVRSLVVFGS